MNKALYLLKKHAPDIMTGVSIVGVGAVAYFSSKNALRAKAIMDYEHPVTTGEIAEVYIRSYWPTAIAAAGTIASIIFTRKVTAQQLAAMVATCTAIESRFADYRDIIRKELNAEKEREIYVETANYDWGIWPDLPHKVDDYDDSYVFYDIYSGRHFVSSIEHVQQAMYHINRNFAARGWACLNEFYDMLGIEKVPNGDDVGWESKDLMEMGLPPWINFYADLKTFHDDVSYYVLSFEVEPTVEAIERALG